MMLFSGCHALLSNADESRDCLKLFAISLHEVNQKLLLPCKKQQKNIRVFHRPHLQKMSRFITHNICACALTYA